MNIDWLNILVKRFSKGFASGFIASLLVFVTSHPLGDFTQVKPWLLAAGTAAFTGGLLALEKMLQGYNPQ